MFLELKTIVNLAWRHRRAGAVFYMCRSLESGNLSKLVRASLFLAPSVESASNKSFQFNVGVSISLQMCDAYFNIEPI